MPADVLTFPPPYRTARASCRAAVAAPGSAGALARPTQEPWQEQQGKASRDCHDARRASAGADHPDARQAVLRRASTGWNRAVAE